MSGSYAGEVKWWDALSPTPQATRTLAAHKGYVRSVAFSPDGAWLATAGNDLVVRIWSAADGSLLQELSGHTSHIYSVAFDASGHSLISGDLLGVVKHWDTGTWKLVRDLDASELTKYDPTFRAHCGGIRAIDFSPDGRFLAVGGIGEVTNAFAGVGKPTVILYDWLTGQKVHIMKPKGNFQGSVFGLRFHPTGEFLVGAGGGSGGGMWFWKMDQPAAIHDFPLPNVAYDLALHPDGLRLIVPLYDNTVRVYDLGAKPAGK